MEAETQVGSVLVYVPPENSVLRPVVLAATGAALDAVGRRGQYVTDLGALGDHLFEVLDGLGGGVWRCDGLVQVCEVGAEVAYEAADTWRVEPLCDAWIDLGSRASVVQALLFGGDPYCPRESATSFKHAAGAR